MTSTNEYAMVLTGDLATFSQIQHAAQTQGLAVVWGRDYGNTQQKIPADGKLHFVIADLSDNRIDCKAIFEAVQSAHPNAKLIAFGPHVQESRLRQAAEAGFHAVMTRGRFFHDLGKVFVLS